VKTAAVLISYPFPFGLEDKPLEGEVPVTGSSAFPEDCLGLGINSEHQGE
jgi:hypothetical protein